MPAPESFELSYIAEYVSQVAMVLSETQPSNMHIKNLIDGYGEIILKDFIPDQIGPEEAANELVALDKQHYPKRTPPQSLYRLCQYVVNVLMYLGDYGYGMDDAVDIVDDYSQVIWNWSRQISAKTAAKRLANHEKRIAVGKREANEE